MTALQAWRVPTLSDEEVEGYAAAYCAQSPAFRAAVPFFAWLSWRLDR